MYMAHIYMCSIVVIASVRYLYFSVYDPTNTQIYISLYVGSVICVYVTAYVPKYLST